MPNLMKSKLSIDFYINITAGQPGEIYSQEKTRVPRLVKDAASKWKVSLRHHWQPRGLCQPRGVLRPGQGLDGPVRHRHFLCQEAFVLHRPETILEAEGRPGGGALHWLGRPGHQPLLLPGQLARPQRVLRVHHGVGAQRQPLLWGQHPAGHPGAQQVHQDLRRGGRVGGADSRGDGGSPSLTRQLRRPRLLVLGLVFLPPGAQET